MAAGKLLAGGWESPGWYRLNFGGRRARDINKDGKFRSARPSVHWGMVTGVTSPPSKMGQNLSARYGV